jgi:hypothetical protein
MNHEQMVTDLSRALVEQIAPEELPLFGATRAASLKNPRRALRGQLSKDEMLGFGGSDDAVFVTPIILAAATAVAEIATESRRPAPGRGLAGLLRGWRKSSPEVAPSTDDPKLRAREAAITALRENNFPPDQVEFVADRLVQGIFAQEASNP